MNRIVSMARVVLLAATVAVTLAAPAQAQEQQDFSDRSLTLGLKAGIYVPGLFTEMGLHGQFTFEIGYMLPFMNKQLAIVFDANYASPGADGSEEDPRIGEDGGTWSYDMSNQQLFLSLGPVFRITPPGSSFVPYVGLFGRYYMLKTTVNGDGEGQPFGENEETSGELGFAAALGGELRLGPGAALAELSLGYAPLGHRITGDVNAGALGFQLGYRLFL